MITDEQKENIIAASHNMIQVLVEVYGSEQGMAFWHQLGDALDPYFKGEIFRRMLCGELSAKIKLAGLNNSWTGGLLPLIKSLRNVDKRRLTLKEARAMSERVVKGEPVYVEPYTGSRSAAIDELTSAGFLI